MTRPAAPREPAGASGSPVPTDDPADGADGTGGTDGGGERTVVGDDAPAPEDAAPRVVTVAPAVPAVPGSAPHVDTTTDSDASRRDVTTPDADAPSGVDARLPGVSPADPDLAGAPDPEAPAAAETATGTGIGAGPPVEVGEADPEAPTETPADAAPDAPDAPATVHGSGATSKPSPASVGVKAVAARRPRLGRRRAPRREAPVRRSTVARVIGNLVLLVICGGLAGAVLAAVALPTVAVGGLGARQASDGFQNLPDEMATAPLDLTSTVTTKTGEVITSFFEQNRVSVRLDQVAPVMQQAIVAAEDGRFYEHRGVDAQGIVRAFVANQRKGQIAQGASTLTQQYVRQYLVYTAKNSVDRRRATERTAARKLREMRYAVGVEKQLTKAKILENYLNIAYFGAESYGVHAAARTYFSKSAKDLTLGEAALLAGLVQSPSTDSPVDGDLARATDRRDYTLDRMAALGFVPAADAAAAKKAKITVTRTKRLGSCAAGRAEYGYFCDWFLSWWRANRAFGRTPNEREAALRRGGYTIQTSIDPRMQAAAQRAIDNRVRRTSRFAAGIVVIEPGTGRVRSMAISRTYSLAKNPGGRSYPNTVNPLLTGSGVSPGYQAGSTFKLFTLVSALRQGLPLDIRINAPDRYPSPVFRASGPASCAGGRYCPRNASAGMAGSHSMWSGFGESVNTFFIQLEERVTVREAVRTAELLGIRFRSKEDLDNKASVQKNPNGSWGAFTLGTSQVAPLDLANAYATVAARGKACTPLPVQSIRDRAGRTLPLSEPSCKQVISPQVADAAADAARCPVGDRAVSACSRRNGVTAASVGRAITRPIAGKSGTTDQNRSAWFVGFTPNLAAAAFTVDPDAPSTSSVPNRKVPAEVFNATMSSALRLMPVRDFVRPTAKMAYGVRRAVPTVDGLSPRDAVRRLRAAGFTGTVVPKRIDSPAPAGRVARTDPAGGTRATVGSSIAVYVSSGKAAPATGPDGKPVPSGAPPVPPVPPPRR